MKRIMLFSLVVLLSTLTFGQMPRGFKWDSPRFRAGGHAATVGVVTTEMVSRHYTDSGAGPCIRNGVTDQPQGCTPVPFSVGGTKVTFFFDHRAITPFGQYSLDDIYWNVRVIPADGSMKYCFIVADGTNTDTIYGTHSHTVSADGGSQYFCRGI